MEKLQLYWHSTLLNYFYLIVIIAFAFTLAQIIRKLKMKYSYFLKIHNLVWSKMRKSRFAYIFIHYISPFLLISISSDFVHLNKHILLTTILWLLILIVPIIILIKYPEVFSLEFYHQIDVQNSYVFTSLILIKSIFYMLMFNVSSESFATIIFILFFILHAWIVIYFVKGSKEDSVLKVIKKKVNWIKYK